MSLIVPILQNFELILIGFNIFLQVDYSFFKLSFDFILLIRWRVVVTHVKLLYFLLFASNRLNNGFSFLDDLLHFRDRLELGAIVSTSLRDVALRVVTLLPSKGS